MTRDGDLQRLLDTWFADGPTQASDRAFDDAIAGVQRQRQRPAWDPRLWRFPTMSTPARTLVLTGAVLAGVVGGSLLVIGGGSGPAPTPPRPPAWPGTMHLPSGGPVVLRAPRDPGGEIALSDRRDVDVGWADIVELTSGRNSWAFELRDWPPQAAALTRASTVLSYGLVFDTTGDGVADLEVGISNDAPRAGDFRVWVTDLATGDTEEQLGPPYGFPVEFAHPNETSPQQGRPRMLFTFLTGPRPDRESRFYAWAAVSVEGEVVAWDYTPDAAWFGIND